MWEHGADFQALTFGRCALPVSAPCTKTQGLGGPSAASWRSQPRTQTVPVLLLAEGTAGLGNPQVKIKDFRHRDFEIPRSEGHSRRLRTDHMATNHQSCPKAMVREFTLLSLSWALPTVLESFNFVQLFVVTCTCLNCWRLQSRATQWLCQCKDDQKKVVINLACHEIVSNCSNLPV